MYVPISSYEIYSFPMYMVNYRLNYANMKMTQTSHFIRYPYQNYMKISKSARD